VLLLTLAPELPGAAAQIRWCRARGMLVALGHTGADAATVAAAAEAGAVLSTHLGNAAPHMQHKFANPIMAQLGEDRLAASFVADGLHVPPYALRAMIRAKGPALSVLVTDATAGAGAPPGRHSFAGMAIERGEDGAMRLPGAGTLAGSALTLDWAVRNLVAWGIASPALAVAMAADTPARLLAPALTAHGIAPMAGEVEWSEALHPVAVRLGDVVVRPGSPP
jgi:N-acetylglucosamine-6-phosphate deacetylase